MSFPLCYDRAGCPPGVNPNTQRITHVIAAMIATVQTDTITNSIIHNFRPVKLGFRAMIVPADRVVARTNSIGGIVTNA